MSDHPPGTETNRLIAKAIGWEFYVGPLGDMAVDTTTRSGIAAHRLFTPSTSIAHSWEVIEWLRARHFDIELFHSGSRPTAVCWVTIRQLDREWRSCGDTAAHAICRAVLLLFGESLSV
jgi:hypothetical protein